MSELGRLSARKHSPPTREGAAVVPAALPGAFETVLLVDEDRATRVSARRSLKSRGYRVIEAGSAQQALLASKRHKGPIALLLTEVVLAGMNGYLLAERLRSERPELKLLFMTTYPGRPDDGSIRLAGTEVVRKPFAAPALCQALSELLVDRS